MTPLNSSPQAKQTPTSMDTPSLIERELESIGGDAYLCAMGEISSHQAMVSIQASVKTIRAAATQLTEERDALQRDLSDTFQQSIRYQREDYKRVADLERVLRDMLDYFAKNDDPSEADLRDPDFWENSYKGAPSPEYITYWELIDRARALLTEDRPAEPTVQEERDAESLHRAERDGVSGSSAVLHREGKVRS